MRRPSSGVRAEGPESADLGPGRYQGEVMLTGAVKEEEDEKCRGARKSVDGVRRI
jgi:hypothetical protein